MIPIAEEITWQTFKEADRFTQAAHIGAAGLALSLVAIFPLFLIFGEGSWMSVLVTVMVAMYGLIFGSAILRLLYCRYRGVPITEQLEIKSDEDCCDWTCPKCGHLCGGIKDHDGAHECVHGPCPKSGVKCTDLQYEDDSSER